MTDKIKNTLIVILIIIIAILSAVLINSKSENKPDEYQAKVSVLQDENSKLLQSNFENDVSTKMNVCTNFLTDYYTVSHSKSKLVNLPKCKKYMTEDLYNYLSPSDQSDAEYSQDEIDMDYNSTISIKNYYADCNDSEKLIVHCTINKTINETKNSNDYFIELHLEQNEDNWLIDYFDIISF